MISRNIVIVPFEPSMQNEAKALVINGLIERWGSNDPTKNSDLTDIASTFKGNSFFVAKKDGVIVGTGAIIRESNISGRIVRMSVSSHLRGQGIGSLILNYLEQIGRDLGYCKLVLETTDTWNDAIDFYKSHGYSICSYSTGDVHFEKMVAI